MLNNIPLYVQLAIEKREFKLRGPTYKQIFFSKYSTYMFTL